MTRNFAYDPQLASRHFPQLNREYGPYTFLRPKSAKKTRVGADHRYQCSPTGSSFHRCSTCIQCFVACSPPLRKQPLSSTRIQQQLVRHSHTRMFRVQISCIDRCEGYEYHPIGHAGLSLLLSIWWL